MSPTLSRLRTLGITAVVLLVAACASSGSGAGAVGDGSAPVASSEGPACREDCSLEVENRLDRDVTVSTERQRGLPALGVVRAHQSGVFDLPDFTGQQIQVWVRGEDSGEIVDVACVRWFPSKRGRLVVGGQVDAEGC